MQGVRRYRRIHRRLELLDVLVIARDRMGPFHATTYLITGKTEIISFPSNSMLNRFLCIGLIAHERQRASSKEELVKNPEGLTTEDVGY